MSAEEDRLKECIRQVQRVLEDRVVRCLTCNTPHVHYCMHVNDHSKCPKYRCNPACKEVQRALAVS